MLTEKTIIELANLLEKGETSAEEIIKEYIKRINTIDKKINAYITFDDEKAIIDAKESDKRRKKGAHLSRYDGIPIAIKDNICTKGIQTSCASGILKDFVPPYDATSVVKIKEMGFIILGKMNMDEFAMGSSTETSYFGPTKNPYNLERVPGGSSGGSAAAVSAMIAPAALGSDTGGSIRLPSSFCGVVGIKPTYGRVSRYGLVAFASSLDQIGTIARTVDDAALLLKVISGSDKKDSTSIERDNDFTDELDGQIEDMIIGIPKEYFDSVSSDIHECIFTRINQLERMGARIKEISLKYTEYAIPIYYLIASAEASSNLSRYDGIRYGTRSNNASEIIDIYKKSRNEGFGKEVKRRIILGTYALSSGYYDAYYLKALKGRSLIIDDFKNVFSKVDVILSPSSTTTAFRIGEKINDPLEMYIMDILTISANLAAIPSLSVPVGLDSNKLPVGLQIMGNHLQEKKILNMAKAVESICDPIHPEV